MSLFFKQTKYLRIVIIILVVGISSLFYLPVAYANDFGARAYFYGLLGAKVMVTNLGMAYIQYLAITLFMTFVPAIVVELISFNIHNKITDKLYKDCDYNSFIKQYRPVIYRLEKRRLGMLPDVFSSYLHYSRALFISGNIKTAIHSLEELSCSKKLKGKSKKRFQTLALLSLSEYYFFSGDKAFARQCQEFSIAGIKNLNKKANAPLLKRPISFSLDIYTILALVLDNDYIKAKEQISVVFGKDITNLERLELNCILSQMFCELGDYEKAREYVEKAEALAPQAYPLLQTKEAIGIAD